MQNFDKGTLWERYISEHLLGIRMKFCCYLVQNGPVKDNGEHCNYQSHCVKVMEFHE